MLPKRDTHVRVFCAKKNHTVVLTLTPQGKDIMQKVDAMWMERVLPILDIPGIILSTLGFGGLLYGFSDAGTSGWGSIPVQSGRPFW
ncbi:UNVERIFIED_CONTAM: membrane-bound ClpP family serine protease [Paenibacillus sp. PvR008]